MSSASKESLHSAESKTISRRFRASRCYLFAVTLVASASIAMDMYPLSGPVAAIPVSARALRLRVSVLSGSISNSNLAVPTARTSWIDIPNVSRCQFVDCFSNIRRPYNQSADAFGVESFYGAASHAAAKNSIDAIARQLVHRMARAMSMMGIAILYGLNLVRIGIPYGKKRR